MFLTGINILKIYILHVFQNVDEPSTESLKWSMKKNAVIDVSYDLLAKTLNSLVVEDLIKSEDNQYVVTVKGEEFYKKNKDNILTFLEVLQEERTPETFEHTIPVELDELFAYKTVPYRYDTLGVKSEAVFFSNKIKEGKPYCFENRGLGKSRYSLMVKREQYDYSDYGILFANAGVIQFIGIVHSYDNANKEVYLKKIIKLLNPISINDIRRNVRTSYNDSQQKQEFFKSKEVTAFTALVKSKMQKYGYIVYSS